MLASMVFRNLCKLINLEKQGLVLIFQILCYNFNSIEICLMASRFLKNDGFVLYNSLLILKIIEPDVHSGRVLCPRENMYVTSKQFIFVEYGIFLLSILSYVVSDGEILL